MYALINDYLTKVRIKTMHPIAMTGVYHVCGRDT